VNWTEWTVWTKWTQWTDRDSAARDILIVRVSAVWKTAKQIDDLSEH
jgi:hypothetical protein